MSKFEAGDMVYIVDFAVSDAAELLKKFDEDHLRGNLWLVVESKAADSVTYAHTTRLALYPIRKYSGSGAVPVSQPWYWWFCDASLAKYPSQFHKPKITTRERGSI